MALRTRYTMENGGGDRYAYPYRTTYTKPMPPADYPVKNVGLIDPSQIVNGAEIAPLSLVERLDLAQRGAVQIIETTNGNGETIQAAVNGNGEIVATKKAPPNIVPIALAAAAAFFFLM